LAAISDVFRRARVPNAGGFLARERDNPRTIGFDLSRQTRPVVLRDRMIATFLRFADVSKADSARREGAVLACIEPFGRQPEFCECLPKSIPGVRVVDALFRRSMSWRRADKDHVESFSQRIRKNFPRHLLAPISGRRNQSAFFWFT